MRQFVRNSVLSALVVGVAIVALVVQPSAHAHVPAEGYHSMAYHYPNAWWQTNNLNVNVHHGDTLAGEYGMRLHDAMDQWNGVGANFRFVWQGYTEAGANCNTPNRNVSFRGVIEGSRIAYTTICVELDANGNPTNRMTGFMIKFDYPPTPSDWYKGGAGTTPPSNQIDFFSVAVHELGHATGGWPLIPPSDDRHMRDSDSSDCPTSPDTLVTYRQTMCQSTIIGTSYGRTPSGYHDRPLLDARY